MKLLKTSTILAAASVLVMAASASAAFVTKDYVRTVGGSPVMTKFGDCVLTKWDAASGKCGAVVGSEMRTVYFNFNSSSLTPAAKTKLNTLAASLRSNHVSAVRIVGYADIIGTESYNLRLSQKRANTVAAYLRGKGIKVTGRSEVRGLGETSSKSECSGVAKGKAEQACLWRDRRVEVEIVN
ncbi:OmpA family protein [Sphingomonas sp.]|uniref:OmpA family protein n=1 Tax=Sphingomonas sp. TaxID=28214 RepID=UPI003CC6B02F